MSTLCDGYTRAIKTVEIPIYLIQLLWRYTFVRVHSDVDIFDCLGQSIRIYEADGEQENLITETDTSFALNNLYYADLSHCIRMKSGFICDFTKPDFENTRLSMRMSVNIRSHPHHYRVLDKGYWDQVDMHDDDALIRWRCIGVDKEKPKDYTWWTDWDISMDGGRTWHGNCDMADKMRARLPV